MADHAPSLRPKVVDVHRRREGHAAEGGGRVVVASHAVNRRAGGGRASTTPAWEPSATRKSMNPGVEWHLAQVTGTSGGFSIVPVSEGLGVRVGMARGGPKFLWRNAVRRDSHQPGPPSLRAGSPT